jgi:hypothetical protein
MTDFRHSQTQRRQIFLLGQFAQERALHISDFQAQAAGAGQSKEPLCIFQLNEHQRGIELVVPCLKYAHDIELF